MSPTQRIEKKAGSTLGLPFVLIVSLLLQFTGALCGAEKPPPTFLEFESSCIDLGRYDAKTKELTVRFVNRKTERFYRYAKVPVEVWKKLQELNETGGVGGYLNETVVTHPEKYPFQELTIRDFKTAPKKKKAGNSK